jgi:ribosomal protein S18 acetylase RimI-like enzyme
MLKLIKSFDLTEISSLIGDKLSGSEIVMNKKRFYSQAIFEGPHKYVEELIREGDSKHIVNCALAGPNGSISGAVIVESSAWDTELFGIGVGKLKLAIFNPDVDVKNRALLFQAIKEQAFANGLDVIFSRIPLDDLPTIHALEAKGAILTDILLTFIRDSNLELISQTGVDIKVMFATPSDSSALSRIAAKTFTINHFHADTRLPKNKCAELYSKWASNSLKGLADAVFVAKRNEEVLGFLTVKIENDCMKGYRKGIIDLVGVKNYFRGIGIGSLLTSRALEWFSDKTDFVIVGTQAANVPAVRLYQRMCFVHLMSEATLHFWTA